MTLGSAHSVLYSRRVHMLLMVLALITAIVGSALGAQKTSGSFSHSELDCRNT